jgi:2-oxoisovalerate dehydrogenase E1 component beta subunit
MLHYSLQAAEMAAVNGIDVEVIDLRTLRPLDEDAIAESASRTGKALIVQEDTPAVSISSEVAAIIGERCFFDLDGPITRLGPPELPPMPFSPIQEAAFMPSPEKILAAITKLSEI